MSLSSSDVIIIVTTPKRSPSRSSSSAWWRLLVVWRERLIKIILYNDIIIVIIINILISLAAITGGVERKGERQSGVRRLNKMMQKLTSECKKGNCFLHIFRVKREIIKRGIPKRKNCVHSFWAGRAALCFIWAFMCALGRVGVLSCGRSQLKAAKQTH